MFSVIPAIVAGLALLAGLPPIAAGQSAPALLDGVVDLDGQPVDPLMPGDGRLATAFIFTTSDCPIANRYAPEIERLFAAYRAQGIRFWLVYVNPREDGAAIRAHARRFALSLPIVRDRHHRLVRRYGIGVTPETAIVDPAGRLAYRGRIDDRYVELGVSRATAVRHDFQDALAALATGRPVPEPRTKAVGCYVTDFTPVTFTRDVAPIVFDKCAGCHRPTGPAPFSLLAYADVRQRATQIAEVTERRYMPPWKAEPHPNGFVGQPRLRDEELVTLRRWAAEGAPEGDTADLPSRPSFPDSWQLGTPDLVVSPNRAFTLGAEPGDSFRIFVIQLPIDYPRHVVGLEFLPGNPRVVHHANIRIDRTRNSRALDDRDPAPGYDGLMPRTAEYPEGHFLGWTPGQLAPLVPADMAWRLEPGTDLVVQLHMQPSGAIEQVRPTIGLFFSDVTPSRTPTILRLGSQGLDIPPGESRHTITDSYVLPADVTLHAVQPHAHYRLKQARGMATLPDGTERTLIAIDDWDFRWQHVYRYERPIRLPKGTRLSMRYTYDNSAANPRNPEVPPRRVRWGQGSFDEMGDLWFQFVAVSDADRALLVSEIQQKMTTEDLIGLETMLGENPADAELHDDAGVLSLALGRAADAVRHFRATVELRPDAAAAHFNLATALTVAGDLDSAVAAYRESLRLRPDYASAHNNLGSALAALGRTGEAITHFRDAVRHDPGNLQAHRNLAWHLATWTSASLADRREAVAIGERADRVTAGRDPQVLDALAAAYAALGDFARAVATVERALAIATDPTLTLALGERLALYRQNRVFRRP
jgi:Flp pilus assembly protein TadD